ncbi:MAG: hypothetical protein OCD03_13135 [Hyphomicrobiales bacterium]
MKKFFPTDGYYSAIRKRSYRKWYSANGKVDVKKRKIKKNIYPPKLLSFSRNPEETFKFFNEAKHPNTTRRMFRLERIEEISTAAALVLTALMQGRFRSFPNVKVGIPLKKWNEDVVHKLDEMGFFSHFGRNVDVPEKKNISNDIILKIKSGLLGEGKDIGEFLHGSLSQFIHGLEDRMELYKPISEGVWNVVEHAYSLEKKKQFTRWWLTGSFNSKSKVLSVSLLDLGHGIPKTLMQPRTLQQKKSSVRVLKYFNFNRKKLGVFNVSDGKLLTAAIEIGRTRTQIKGRGRGLYDIVSYLENYENSKIRILSGKGEYSREIVNGAVVDERKNELPEEFVGTMVQWHLQLQ